MMVEGNADSQESQNTGLVLAYLLVRCGPSRRNLALPRLENCSHLRSGQQQRWGFEREKEIRPSTNAGEHLEMGGGWWEWMKGPKRSILLPLFSFLPLPSFRHWHQPQKKKEEKTKRRREGKERKREREAEREVNGYLCTGRCYRVFSTCSHCLRRATNRRCRVLR